MFYTVTLNNSIATITSSIILSEKKDRAICDLEKLRAAHIILLDSETPTHVAEELKNRALTEISLKRKVWENLVHLFFGCFGYQTTTQKVESLFNEIIQKNYEKLGPSQDLEPEINEKPSEQKPREFGNKEVEELIINEAEFKRLALSLENKMFDQARLQINAIKFEGASLCEGLRKAIYQYIALKEIDSLFSQGLFSEELLVDVTDEALKKDILNRAERSLASQEFPELEVFINNPSTLEVEKLHEALKDYMGNDPNRILNKIVQFYMVKKELKKARYAIPFIPDSKLRFEMTKSLACTYLLDNDVKACLELLYLLPVEMEEEAKKEAVLLGYFHTKSEGLVHWILHKMNNKDDVYLSLSVACVNRNRFTDAEHWTNSIQNPELKEEAFKKISVRRNHLEKQAQLAAFAENYVGPCLPSSLSTIDLSKIVQTLIDKIQTIDSLEKQHACYAYLASLNHFELALIFAKLNPHVLALKMRYGLFKEKELESKIKKWLPHIHSIKDPSDYKVAESALQYAFNFSELNHKKMRIEFYHHALNYFKGKLIEAYIYKGHYDEAKTLAADIRFIDFRMGVYSLIDDMQKLG